MLTLNRQIVRCDDHRFDADENNSQYMHHLFVRLSAKNKTFTKVDFRYCVFDGCYLRGCRFIACDFTGCRFLSTNFHGSSFSDCQFAYATFEKTAIVDDILESQAPDLENQKVKFARALRVNYQQLGEARSVNKAIKIELEATRLHLRKAWGSKKDYYRRKYSGIKRITSFFQWLGFSVLHLLWGNGESAFRLICSLVVLFALMALYHAIHVGDPAQVASYWRGLCAAPSVFLGVRTSPQYSDGYVTSVAIARLLFFAALTSILIKRFTRR